jgi:Zn-dependent protease with chaperone function
MVTIILESALRTAITVVLVWATLRLLRISHVLAQKVAWCLVLAAAIAMPSVMRWHAFKFPLPIVLSSHSAIWPLDKAQSSPRVHIIEDATLHPMGPAIKSPDAAPNVRQSTAKLYPFTATVYSTICAILLLRLLLGFTWAFRVWRRGQPVFGLSTTLMRVRSRSDISTPLTIGFGVVLPSTFNDWDPAKLRMVLAHERSHIRQADFFLQLLARFHTAFFWFSPAAWWLQKELAALGEAISDHAAIIEAPDRCSYAEVLLEFAAMSRRSVPGIAMARPTGINRRIERILNDTLFRSAFLDRKSHMFVAAATFFAALLIATSHFVVRSEGTVSRPNAPAGQEIVQKTSIGLPIAESSDARDANPQIEMLTPVTESEQAVARREAGLIRQRAEDGWVKAMPKGMNSRARIVSPDSLSQTQTAIEFSVGSNGHISNMVLVHASGQLSLDRAAWSALTDMDPPRSFPGLPSRKLRYRITFAYDNRMAHQPNSGNQAAVTHRDQNTPYQINLSWPKDATQHDAGFSQNFGAPPHIAGTFAPIKLPLKLPLKLPPLLTFMPPIEKSALEEGCVIDLIVDENGIPQNVRDIHHLGVECDRDFVNAVEQFRFMPATSDFKRVPASLTIEVLAARGPHYQVSIRNIE